MKRWISLLLAVLMAISLAACAASVEEPEESPQETPGKEREEAREPANGAMNFKPGVYTGTAPGNNGDITVEVTCTEAKITNIDVVEEDETYYVFMYPKEQILAEILETQNLAVDTVAGATVSSRGLIAAVEDALIQAGVERDELYREVQEARSETQTLDCEVLVIGAGFAGLSAANRLHQQGVDVLLIEQLDYVGGSGRFSTGGFMMADSEESLQIMKNYMAGRYYFDDFPVAEGTPDLARVERNLEATRDVYDMLMEFGIEVILATPDISAYIFNVPENLAAFAAEETGINTYGSWGAEQLGNAYKEQGGRLMLHTKATSLLQTSDGRVTGANAKGKDCDYVINANYVVLATGSYSHNDELLSENLPWRVGDYTCTTIGADGSGIEMALAAGGVMTEDNYVNGGARVADSHTAMSTHDGLWTSSDCLSSVAMIVGLEGERLASELDDRYFRYYPNYEGQDQFFCIYDAAQLESVGMKDQYDALVSEEGPYYRADTLEELAKLCKFEEQTFLDSVETFNYYCATGQDVFDASLIDTESFNQDNHNGVIESDSETKLPVAQGPFYAVRLTFVSYDIIGGIKTGDQGEVLTAGGEAIPGLYAIGFTSSRDFLGSGTAHGYCLMLALSTGVVTADAIVDDLNAVR